MIAKVRELKSIGKQVKIFTHRVNSSLPEEEREAARLLIEDWCEENIGYRLPVTSEKDEGLIEFYDDSAIQVESNRGIIQIPPFEARF